MRVQVLVKPNARKTEVLEYNPETKTYHIAVASAPNKDKANLELLRFLRIYLGAPVQMVSGHRARRKTIEVTTSSQS